jgi:raffinose/stachyose/melibiose transport system substrate-binding protein
MEVQMKKFTLICLSILLVAGLAFGAGKKNAQVFEVSVNTTDAKQVAVYENLFKKLVADYNAAKGTKISLKFVSAQGMDIINTRMSSRDKPDIFTIDSPADVNQFGKDGLLLDLTSYAKRDKWSDSLFDWAYSLSQVNGKVMALPYGYEGMVIWYNKTLMAKLGLNPDKITTLEDFEGAMKAASDAGLIPVMLGSQNWPWAQEWYLSILFSYTGRDLVKNTVEGKSGYSWNSPQFKKTVELYKSWHDKKYLADGRSYILTSDDAINAFVNDKALFKVEGTWAPYWMMPLDAAQRAKFGVMLHPAIGTGEKPHLPLAIGGMWCVSADTQNKDLAAFILKGLLNPDIQPAFLDNGMDIAPIALDSSKFKNLDPVVQKMWTLVNGALANGSFGYATWAFYPPATRVYLYEGIVNVLENKKTVDEYLNEMQRLNQKELKEGFKPVIPAAKK